MNCREANEIPIADFLFMKGIEPKKVHGNNYWYLSPLRDERTPSFKVDVSLNRWYDHGIGVGGKLVDLGIRQYEITVAEFLNKLREERPKSFFFHKPVSEYQKPIVKKIKRLENRALLDYLSERRIEIATARIFCSEVYFSLRDKNYFSICFKNDLDGYEVRNKFFKGSLGAKSITTFVNESSHTFALFEGFIDFLTAYQLGLLSGFSFIILNSVNQIGNAITKLNKHKPEHVLSYFDNDSAGKKCFQQLKDSFPNAVNCAHQYSGFKDFNELIMSQKTKYNG